VLLALSAAAPGPPAHPSAQAGTERPEEPLRWVSLLDNGDFGEALPARGARAVVPIPWWITTRGAAELEQDEASRPCLRTEGEDRARQPVAAFAPLVSRLTVKGEIRGRGDVAWIDGSEGRAVISVGDGSDAFVPFELAGSDFESALGRPLVPRLVLELSSSAAGGALWRGLQVRILLPDPSEAELAARIEAELARIFDTWLARSLDTDGPRSTAFVAHAFDVVTGERLMDVAGGYSLFYELLFHALEGRERADWRAAFERHLEDYFALAFHPSTGLPRSWKCAEDVPDDESYVEIAMPLAFTIDLAERGPESFRERARAAALAIGETVLARGLLPDGAIAPRYRSRDGMPSTSAVALRALNLPAQLARLGTLGGDPRFAAAAEEALVRFEYTHYWPGTWEEIDPGFDDEFGNYGARALDIARALPDQPIARRIAGGGYEHYAPLWNDALRLGGNVAADQVRCWKIFGEVAELERFDAGRRAELVRLLRAAVRSHFKGEQYGNGAWGDVTVWGFSPKENLQVGDLPGLPQNLMQGIAYLYDEKLTSDKDELRAMFAAVLESSLAAYGRPYGVLATRRELQGQNLCNGSLRFAVGLVEMLRRL
jgi:hypothetical protein